MATASLLLYLAGAYPVWLAWRANRRTSLAHAVTWAVAAWVAWGGMMVCRSATSVGSGLDPARYLALCLTGCAGVAVLGARRPGVTAWNFVVLGLLLVMGLPLWENLVLADKPLDTVRGLFVAATLAAGILNYLPTRLGLAAVCLGFGCACEFMALLEEQPGATAGWLALALAPWLALAAQRESAARSAFDQLWLDFRDRFGLVWAQRVREQFNAAAANAGWPVHLYWQGLRLTAGAAWPDPATQEAMLAALRALLRRFVPASEGGP